MSAEAIRTYLGTADVAELIRGLRLSHAEQLVETVGHFTWKEAKRRNEIVLGYFGEEGVTRIVDTIVHRLLSHSSLGANAKILDVGAGTGVFTEKVAEKVRRRLPRSSFFAMDVTPAMLMELAKRDPETTPFLGVAEDIAGSVALAQRVLPIPSEFDALFSTLTLHHCPDMGMVFASMKEVLKPHGMVVVVDLCKHPFEEFREEMGDLHLGFDPSDVREAASEHFSEVDVEMIPGMSCDNRGRSTDLFVATMF